jgi:hypothetical protein
VVCDKVAGPLRCGGLLCESLSQTEHHVGQYSLREVATASHKSNKYLDLKSSSFGVSGALGVSVFVQADPCPTVMDTGGIQCLTRKTIINEKIIQFQPNTVALLSRIKEVLCFSLTPQILSTLRPRIIAFSLMSTASNAVKTEPLHII